MASLCDKTPIPIALDEELIGVFDLEGITNPSCLIPNLPPQYLVFKPTLLGGFSSYTTMAKSWLKQ